MAPIFQQGFFIKISQFSNSHFSTLISQQEHPEMAPIVLVEKSPSKFITSIYRKPTFTSQYLRWNSFSPRKRKTNLILTLTHRALAICSPERLQSRLDKIKFILLTNG